MVRAYFHVCAAKQCYNTWLNHPNKGFFCFPRDKELCRIWLQNCGRTDLEVSVVEKSNGYYKLCSDHFEDKYFTDHTKAKLKRTSQPVPTNFVNNIGDLLPQGSQTLDIDLPDNVEQIDPSTCCECLLDVLDPSQQLVQSDRLPISYRKKGGIEHSNQVTKKQVYDPDTISQALVNLNPETELYELENLCRFCMNKAPQVCVNLFSEKAEAAEIRQTCALLLRSKIDVSDRLPHKVCPQCVTDLGTCRRLMDQFKSADRYLRAVAKYSLFIGSETESETENDIEEKNDDELMKSIPKRSLVMPLKTLKPILEDTNSYIEGLNANVKSKTTEDDFACKHPLPQEKITEATTADVDMNSKTNDSALTVNQLLQPLPENAPDIGIITASDDLWQEPADWTFQNNRTPERNGVELICSNMTVLPSQHITVASTEKTPVNKNIPNLSSEKIYGVPLYELKNLEKDIALINSSEYSSENQLGREIDIQNVGVEPVTEYIDSELIKQLRNISSNVNCESGECDSGLSVSYKCLECYSPFSSYAALVDHVLTNHQKIDKMSDVNTTALQNPMLLMEAPIEGNENNELKCLVCDSSEVFPNKASLIDHVKNIHMWKCTVCNLIFQTEKRLEEHMFSRHDTRTECNVCGKQLKTPQSRRTHEQGHNEDYKEVCWHCGAVLKSKQSLCKHLMLHSDKTFPCKICNRPFKTNTLRSKHQMVHRNEPVDKKFLCDLCPKKFQYSGSLKAHILTHSDEKPFKCRDCGKRFRKLPSLRNHQNIRSLSGECPKHKMWGKLTLKEGANFSCDICGRKFYKSAGVERHRKFHFCSGNPEIIKKLLDEPEVYTCNICCRFIFTKLGFQGHLGRHTNDERPYSCDFCGKTFKYINLYKIHERLHTGETPFTCKLCGRGFRSKLSLNSHETTHSLTKPHLCQICDKNFKSKKQLVKHYDVVHKDQGNHQCPECSKMFAHRNSLQKHMKRVHIEKVEEDAVQYMEYLDTVVDYVDSDFVQDSNNVIQDSNNVIQEITYCIGAEEFVDQM